LARHACGMTCTRSAVGPQQADARARARPERSHPSASHSPATRRTTSHPSCPVLDHAPQRGLLIFAQIVLNALRIDQQHPALLRSINLTTRPDNKET
jgi:hypothetical protein